MAEHADDSAELVDVAVLRLPVPVWLRAQEQSDALMREFALIASDHEGHVPRRLLDLVGRLNAGYSGFTQEQEQALESAAREGRDEVDLHYRVPRSVGEASRELEAMLEEADAFCRSGDLLTLAPTQEGLRFRRWFLAQFVDQAEGAPAVAWPDYEG